MRFKKTGLIRAALVRALVIGAMASCVYVVAVYHPFFRSPALSRIRPIWTQLLWLYWLIPFPLYFFTFLLHPERRMDSGSKPLLALALCRRLCRGGLSGLRPAFRSFHARLTVLSFLVKLYYMPLMTTFFWEHLSFLHVWLSEIPAASSLIARDWILGRGYSVLYQAIFFLDTAIFTFGYAVELPSLKSRIRSVEPTLLGWVVTLICYPPFNEASNVMFGRFGPGIAIPEPVRAVANIGILLCFLVYVWASFALLFKASNLTHRGIVGHGPYRFVRHPAYAAKNVAWWLEWLPALAHPANIVSIVGWNCVYIARAITEERHLRRDPTYDEYCRKVRYRFIPGLV